MKIVVGIVSAFLAINGVIGLLSGQLWPMATWLAFIAAALILDRIGRGVLARQQQDRQHGPGPTNHPS